MATGDDDPTQHDRAPSAQYSIGEPTSRQRQVPNRGNIRTVNNAGIFLVQREPAFGKRLGHVEQQDGSHAVVREAFPHLREKECGEAAGMTKETTVVTGSSRILRCAHSSFPLFSMRSLRERPGGLSQNVRKAVKHEPRMRR